MQKLCKPTKRLIWISTIVWSIIMLIICAGINSEITAHFSFEVWLEFSKAILLCYITSILCAFGIEHTYKRNK